MVELTEFLKTQFKRPGTIPPLFVGSILIVVALIVGISDNPPGVWLVYLGLIFLCFSLVHHWREAGRFGTLLAVAVISFPVLVLIHNIFDTLNDKIGNVPVVNQLFGGLAAISFIGGVLIAPAVVMVGVIGGLFYLIKKQPK